MQKLEKREDGFDIVEKFVCGADGANLSIAWGGAFGVEGYIVRCANDPQHEGYKPRTSALQAVRRTAGTGIENIPMDAASARRQIGLLSIRYPDILVDGPSAALFLYECKRLSLDPLISPAEAIPVAFTSKKLGRKVIAMIISSDGWLSMAARSEPGRWGGPPSLTLVSGDLKKAIADDNPGTMVVEAKGKVRDQESRQLIDTSNVHGWFRSTESSQVTTGNSPWNMACKRAIKRWVRENYPACRQIMAEQTAPWMAESAGIKVTEDAIEAEFRILEPEQPHAKALTTDNKAQAQDVSEHTVDRVDKPVQSFIDLPWLNEQLKILKWKEVGTYLKDKYQVTGKSVSEAVSKLTAEKAAEFTGEIESRLKMR